MILKIWKGFLEGAAGGAVGTAIGLWFGVDIVAIFCIIVGGSVGEIIAAILIRRG